MELKKTVEQEDLDPYKLRERQIIKDNTGQPRGAYIRFSSLLGSSRTHHILFIMPEEGDKALIFFR